MSGRGRKGGRPKGTSARAGGMMAPPAMRKKPGSPSGLVSKTNQDGDIFTRKSPYKKARMKSMCFITTACVEAKGLPEDCYELRLLRLFREEYVRRLPDGEAVLAEYREKAPRVVEAIGRLGEEAAAQVWEHLYERGVARSVALITNGSWDEAYEVYRQMCREMEERFLEGAMRSPMPPVGPSSDGAHQIDHEHGVFVGIDLASSSPITLDNRELVNPNSVTIGQAGGGRTFVTKCMSTRHHKLGRRIVMVDPETNSGYARVAREIGGEFALIAPGSPHKINPFDLHDDYFSSDLWDDALLQTDGEDEEEAYRRARAHALDGKVQELARTVSLMLSSDSARDRGLSGAEAGYVERAIYEAYRRKGITRDRTTHDGEPPTFTDFFSILSEYAAEIPELGALYEGLYPWHSGALSTIFDAQTNVDVSNRFLVLRVGRVKGRHKAQVMHAVLEFASGILSNPEEPAECYIIEPTWIFKDPITARFFESLWRSARTRNCGMHATSQQPLEFFGSPEGQLILGLSATHMIFRHGGRRESAEATARYYDFSEEETYGLDTLQTGEGYLVAGQTRLPLKVMASPEEEELFTTRPGPAAAERRATPGDAPPAAKPGGGSEARGAPTQTPARANSSGEGHA